MTDDASGVVPSVMKTDSRGEGASGCDAPDAAGVRIGNGNASGSDETVTLEDRDFLCPICLAMIKDAFLTLCGHSFCYMCIITHLNNKNDCPSCGHYLTANKIFPNFLLEKLLKKIRASQISKTASPSEHFHLALQACEMSVKELDSLLYLLAEKKRKTEADDSETNMQILTDFLQCVRKQKVEELSEVQKDLHCIKEDLNVLKNHRIELQHARERQSVKLCTLEDDLVSKTPVETLENHVVSSAHNVNDGMCSESSQGTKKIEKKSQWMSQTLPRRDFLDNNNAAKNSPMKSELSTARKRRIHQEFNELQECYLQRRRHGVSHVNIKPERNTSVKSRAGYHPGLEDFQSMLMAFTRYSRFQVVAQLRQGDLFHTTNIVSSIEFDRDDELFATAGVSKCIKVFELSTVVNEPVGVHSPVVDIPTRSKLSCVNWNKCSKNIIASSDYEGIVNIWDVNTKQNVMEYEEHEKRAWSVDFSQTDPSMLVSGSDDFKVKIWCMNQETSVLNIVMKANICCVKYNPGSSNYVAVGSADRHIHYYDLRNIITPLHVFKGHLKAVSYVKFLSNNELASASTDSTLRLWDVQDNCLVRTFEGHRNDKNFVGLTVNNDYIACGSETNEVVAYHKAVSNPAAVHKFGSSDMNDTDVDANSHFISAVCWKRYDQTMLAANSLGTIKVLVLAT